jgi:hypothetical protein
MLRILGVRDCPDHLQGSRGKEGKMKLDKLQDCLLALCFVAYFTVMVFVLFGYRGPWALSTTIVFYASAAASMLVSVAKLLTRGK